jgi:hypothetical protein
MQILINLHYACNFTSETERQRERERERENFLFVDFGLLKYDAVSLLEFFQTFRKM